MTTRPEIAEWGQLLLTYDEIASTKGPASLDAQSILRKMRDKTRAIVYCSPLRWRLLIGPVLRAYKRRWAAKRRREKTGPGTGWALACELAWRRMGEQLFEEEEVTP